MKCFQPVPFFRSRLSRPVQPAPLYWRLVEILAVRSAAGGVSEQPGPGRIPGTGRAALRLHRPRNGALGRLGHAAPGRLAVVRKTAAAVLADRGRAPPPSRLGRMGRAAAPGADQPRVPVVLSSHARARIFSPRGAGGHRNSGDVRRLGGVQFRGGHRSADVGCAGSRDADRRLRTERDPQPGAQDRCAGNLGGRVSGAGGAGQGIRAAGADRAGAVGCAPHAAGDDRRAARWSPRPGTCCASCATDRRSGTSFSGSITWSDSCIRRSIIRSRSGFTCRCCWRDCFRGRRWPALLFRPKTYQDERIRFLVLWLVFALVFFSVAQNKLPGYVLPLLPALAIVLAVALDKTPAAGWWIGACVVLLIATPAIAALLPDALLSGVTSAHFSFSRLVARGWPFALAAGGVFWLAWVGKTSRKTRAGDAGRRAGRSGRDRAISRSPCCRCSTSAIPCAHSGARMQLQIAERCLRERGCPAGLGVRLELLCRPALAGMRRTAAQLQIVVRDGQLQLVQPVTVRKIEPTP